MIRQAAPNWGQTFLPHPGCYPPAATPRRDERLIHVCLRVPGDPQTALANALRGLTRDGGTYAEVDWVPDPRHAGEKLRTIAQQLKPTFVFVQVQTADVLSVADLEVVRRFADPSCVIVNWDGDRHYEADAPQRAWFRDLSRGCDASAVVCTRDAENYAKLGVKGAAFLQIGVDADLWKPTDPSPNTPAVVMLASDYPHLQSYNRRVDICRKLTAALPGQFAVYGYGWQRPDVASRPFLQHHEEAPVYSGAMAAVCMSIRNDLPRYSSDRLFRVLASGTVPLVEWFPDCEGLGLVDQVNCLLWHDWDELRCLVNGPVLDNPGMRQAARALALEHTWEARMFELAAVTNTIREDRQ